MPRPQIIPLEDTTELRAMRLRVYLTPEQDHQAAEWLYTVHWARNKVVSLLSDRRMARVKWTKNNPSLSKEDMPDELRLSDITSAQAWLTGNIQHARHAARMELAVRPNKHGVSGAVHQALGQLTSGERAELDPMLPLVRVPRTLLDQMVRDVEKSYSKAIDDRMRTKNKQTVGRGKQSGLAGWPTTRKFSYASSVRMQVYPTRQAGFREHWVNPPEFVPTNPPNANPSLNRPPGTTLFLPGLGLVTYRDSGYDLPTSPPKLITLARDAAGHWFVSFVAVDHTDKHADKMAQPMPVDANGLPVIRGLDLGLTDRTTDDLGQTTTRTRHMKRYLSRLRKNNKSLARKRHGSKRWIKAKKSLGRTHVHIANWREYVIRQDAQAIVTNAAIVCVEDLKLAFMLRNRCLAQGAHDVAMGRFVEVLTQECHKYGVLLLKAPKRSATTQICSTCGFKNKALKNNITIRDWECPQCGAEHQRDQNAAINVVVMALEEFLKRMNELSETSETPTHSGWENRLADLGYRLKPELQDYIARGGLTSALADRLAQVSHPFEGAQQLSSGRRGSHPTGEACTPTPASTNRMERLAGA